MALLSRILMPVAFSARCRGAVRYAEALAAHFHSDLVLLHVVEPLIWTYVSGEAVAYSPAGDEDTLRVEQAQTQLSELAVEGDAGGFQVSRVVMRGEPVRDIVRYAHENQFDLIVMPTHGHGPFRRLLLGSVTAKVLHDADCPVWTGPHLEEMPVPQSISFRRILCALDLGAESPAVLGWAARFAHEYGAHVTIVHVLPAAAADVGGAYIDPEWRARMVETARQQIAAMQEELSIRGEVVVETGNVPAGVTGAAARLGAELLVIGRGRRTGVLGRLRAKTYAILRESPCPVAAV